jgi:predicted nucleotidyltransferase
MLADFRLLMRSSKQTDAAHFLWQGEAMKPKIEVRPGDRVLLKDDTVIACDRDARRIMEIYNRSGDPDLVISKEPVSRRCYYRAASCRPRQANPAKAAIFGSVARGESREGSDVDILVEVGPDLSLLGFAGLKQDLEDALGRPVDLVEYSTIKPLLRDRILAEQVVIA